MLQDPFLMKKLLKSQNMWLRKKGKKRKRGFANVDPNRYILNPKGLTQWV